MDLRLLNSKENEALNKVENFLSYAYQEADRMSAVKATVENPLAFHCFINFLKNENHGKHKEIINEISKLGSYDDGDESLQRILNENGSRYSSPRNLFSSTSNLRPVRDVFNSRRDLRHQISQHLSRNMPNPSDIPDNSAHAIKFVDAATEAFPRFIKSKFYQKWRDAEVATAKTTSCRASFFRATLPEMLSADMENNPLVEAEVFIPGTSDSPVLCEQVIQQNPQFTHPPYVHSMPRTLLTRVTEQSFDEPAAYETVEIDGINGLHVMDQVEPCTLTSDENGDMINDNNTISYNYDIDDNNSMDDPNANNNNNNNNNGNTMKSFVNDGMLPSTIPSRSSSIATISAYSSPSPMIPTAYQQAVLARRISHFFDENRVGNKSCIENALKNIDPIEIMSLLKADQWLFAFICGVENLPMSISISTASKDRIGFPLIYVNNYFKVLTGYERQEVIGENCKFLQKRINEDYPVQRDSVFSLNAALKNAESTIVSIINFRKDGSFFRNMVGIKPVLDIQGEYRYVMGIQLEVRADDDVEDNYVRVRELLNSIPGMLWKTNSDVYGSSSM